MSIETNRPILPEDFIGNPAPFFSIEESLSVTHSLATVANQKVLVIVKGAVGGASGDQEVDLKYDGVSKDNLSINLPSGSTYYPFTLMYSAIPGESTANITVQTGGGVSLRDVRIVVQKLLVG